MKKPELPASADAKPAVSGWAVLDEGRPLIRTVMDTRRGAIVNWLVCSANCMVMNSHTDEQIEKLWLSFKPDGFECGEVEIFAALAAATDGAPAAPAFSFKTPSTAATTDWLQSRVEVLKTIPSSHQQLDFIRHRRRDISHWPPRTMNKFDRAHVLATLERWAAEVKERMADVQ